MAQIWRGHCWALYKAMMRMGENRKNFWSRYYLCKHESDWVGSNRVGSSDGLEYNSLYLYNLLDWKVALTLIELSWFESVFPRGSAGYLDGLGLFYGTSAISLCSILRGSKDATKAKVKYILLCMRLKPGRRLKTHGISYTIAIIVAERVLTQNSIFGYLESAEKWVFKREVEQGFS